MRSLILIVPLMLGGCANGDFFGQAQSFLDEVRAEGTSVSDRVLINAAVSFDAYCRETPTAVRDWLRTEINARTDEYDASDFCVPKPDPEPVVE